MLVRGGGQVCFNGDVGYSSRVACLTVCFFFTSSKYQNGYLKFHVYTASTLLHCDHSTSYENDVSNVGSAQKPTDLCAIRHI